MKKLFFSMLCLFTLVFANAQTIDGISLKNVTTGQNELLANILAGTKSVIIFVDTDCPFVNSYKQRIKEFSEEAMAKGYKVIFVNPHEEKKPVENSLAQMKRSAAASGWKGTFYSDAGQNLVQILKATKLPEVFIVKTNGKNMNVLYVGAIDDNPQNAAEVKEQFALDALTKITSSGSAAKVSTVTMGCRIKKF